ncbi:hypothetical protein [Dethiothermospora halolimnae]|uniref:hypothetical protein n=1 Tax=Dethiothermospora halolimnae TaxID=3114390 RepID=UPI003CCB8C8F
MDFITIAVSNIEMRISQIIPAIGFGSIIYFIVKVIIAMKKVLDIEKKLNNIEERLRDIEDNRGK